MEAFFDYKDYQMAGYQKKMTLTHQNLFGVCVAYFA
jgi:hypothetical protein